MTKPLPWLSRDSQHFLIRGLKARFLAQRIEFRLIRQHVRSADTVCDIGANKGSFVFWLSRWCRNGRVVAFEPQPQFAQLVARLASDLKLDNVTVEQKAAFSKPGQADLFVPKGHSPGASLVSKTVGASDFETISVPMVRLDDYFAQHEQISFMKVDVEGAELDVFKGAERILREQSPLLIFECESRHLDGTRVEDVFAYLNALGYAGYFVAGSQLLSVAKFDAAIHQRQDGEWFWKAKGYYNNFVFSKTPLPDSQS
ncbi:FkbM family methyltransferase [Bradyrhizobium sp. Tv2a-2]|uniref:FkbM family methyltransferase n=1 Tax=Bradyrhizobium sp. Tv2a-2 TaxID=113395 RepID=UPI000559E8C1|nr:FkbM family methyltransferase [Bradyrhizobium sp. Tv2a-2]